MNQLINPGNGKPRINVDAKANLDIKLDGWQGTAAVGFLGLVAVIISGLYFKSRS